MIKPRLIKRIRRKLKPERSGFTELPQRRGIEMKNNYRKALAVLVLVLVFSSSAFADDGILWPEKTPPPPPPTANSTNTGDAASTTEATGGIMWPEATETLIEVGSSLLRDALTLL
jgi:hypothetical protein